jgi:hypothetical protein
MYSKTAASRDRWSGQLSRWMSSFLSVAKKLSATALMLLCQGGGALGVAEVGEQ